MDVCIVVVTWLLSGLVLIFSSGSHFDFLLEGLGDSRMSGV